ncbi:hypothetical protein, partial [Coprobacter fastidiosus]|uniref:hypothetical protein n=1 Tax=Coprobacter fastidiosus TaxID=1099853 RepID=UPI003AB66653
LNTILVIAIMFVCCNGKIILFTEINNSKKGLSHFLDSPFFIITLSTENKYENVPKPNLRETFNLKLDSFH